MARDALESDCLGLNGGWGGDLGEEGLFLLMLIEHVLYCNYCSKRQSHKVSSVIISAFAYWLQLKICLRS